MSNQKENTFHINIGFSSILLIFVILCLVAFATLSIVSANADSKLSNKIVERSKAYYEAHNQAEINIANLDKTLTEAYAQAANEEEYFSTVGHNKSYMIPITDMQSLSVNVNILYPTNSGDTFYEITSWQVVTTGEVEYSNNMIVIP